MKSPESFQVAADFGAITFPVYIYIYMISIGKKTSDQFRELLAKSMPIPRGEVFELPKVSVSPVFHRCHGVFIRLFEDNVITQT